MQAETLVAVPAPRRRENIGDTVSRRGQDRNIVESERPGEQLIGGGWEGAVQLGSQHPGADTKGCGELFAGGA